MRFLIIITILFNLSIFANDTKLVLKEIQNLRDKKEQEYNKTINIAKGLLYTLRKLVQDNEKVAKSLRAASLM